MTHPDDNTLLAVAKAHAQYCEDIESALDKVRAVLAFAFLCALMWLALHYEVVLS